jgi:DNA modification methylase
MECGNSPFERALMAAGSNEVLALLGEHTYDEVRNITGWSRGKIYSLALRSGARKTENRIRERQEERKKRQLETLAEMMNSTAKADVLDFFDGIPDDSIDAHISSPPYNLGKAYGECASADSMRHVYFHGFLMQVVSEMARTVKPGGVVCLNTGKTRDWQDCLMPMDVMLYDDLRKAGLRFVSRVIWTIPHGLTPKGRLADRYETVLIFSKGDQVTFNPNAARVPQRQPDKRAFKGPNRGKLSGHPYGAAPSDVWNDIPNVGHNHPDSLEGKHPAQFPVNLAKRAILLYSKAGDLVCDAFSGSGSTQIASKQTGRAFIGADLFYDDLRERRLAKTTLDSFTPLPGVTGASVAVWQAEARRVEHQVVTMPTPAEEHKMCEQLRIFA